MEAVRREPGTYGRVGRNLQRSVLPVDVENVARVAKRIRFSVQGALWFRFDLKTNELLTPGVERLQAK
jgi:hypothetical protein